MKWGVYATISVLGELLVAQFVFRQHADEFAAKFPKAEVRPLE